MKSPFLPVRSSVLNPAMSAESRVAATIASDAVIPIAHRAFEGSRWLK